jgi:hypothetical protein
VLPSLDAPPPTGVEQIGNPYIVVLLRQSASSRPESGAGEHQPLRRPRHLRPPSLNLLPCGISERSACNVKGLTAAAEF